MPFYETLCILTHAVLFLAVLVRHLMTPSERHVREDVVRFTAPLVVVRPPCDNNNDNMVVVVIVGGVVAEGWGAIAPSPEHWALGELLENLFSVGKFSFKNAIFGA